MNKVVISSCLCLIVSVCLAGVESSEPSPIKAPYRGVAMDRTHIYFGLDGNLWRVPRQGGEAEPLTSSREYDAFPVVLGPGEVAFARFTSGSWDVYLYRDDVGTPKRLTYHPAVDLPVNRGPDGELIFLSMREGLHRARLYKLRRGSPFPEPTEPAPAFDGAINADGLLAFQPRSIQPRFREFRFYRGGLRSPLWLAEDGSGRVLVPATYDVRFPVAQGSYFFFIGNPEGVANLYRVDPKSGALKQLTHYTDFGPRFLAADAENLVFVRDGGIFLMDPSNGDVQPIRVQLPNRLDPDRKRIENVDPVRAVLDPKEDGEIWEAGGDLFKVTARDNSTQNLTKSPGVAEREPACSSSGRLAFFSDQGGLGYQLHIREIDGRLSRYRPPSGTFYRDPVWSPDGSKLSFADETGVLWLWEEGEFRQIDQSHYAFQERFGVSWSPDSRYLTYSSRNQINRSVLRLWDSRAGQFITLPSLLGDAFGPVFDAGGRYLYFLTSGSMLDLDVTWSNTSTWRALSRYRAQLAVLCLYGDPAPIRQADGKPNLEVWSKPVPTEALDPDKIRIFPVPIPTDMATGLYPGSAGRIRIQAWEWDAESLAENRPRIRLYHFDFRDPGNKTLLAVDPRHVVTLPGQDKVVFQSGGKLTRAYLDNSGWHFASARPTGLALYRNDYLDYRQMFHETFRHLRAYFYDPNYHGSDPGIVESHFARYLPAVADRNGLNDLLSEAVGFFSVSHSGVGGGEDYLLAVNPGTGMLGADFELDPHGYRLTEIYKAPNDFEGYPGLYAPMAEAPGVKPGMYLLAVNGRQIHSNNNLFRYFQQTAGRETKLRFSADPEGRDPFEVTVLPLADDRELRVAAWAEANREEVEAKTQGRWAYVHIQRFGEQALRRAERAVALSREMDGLIIDTRFNLGGTTADQIAADLALKPLYHYKFRHGRDYAVPLAGSHRKVIVLINEWNASAAETFPFMIRQGDIGTLIGTDTMGAGIGPSGSRPSLIDGGRVAVPNRGAFAGSGLDGWFENRGVQPHIRVEPTPQQHLNGEDAQLERALMETSAGAEGRADSEPRYPVHPGRLGR